NIERMGGDEGGARAAMISIQVGRETEAVRKFREEAYFPVLQSAMGAEEGAAAGYIREISRARRLARWLAPWVMPVSAARRLFVRERRALRHPGRLFGPFSPLVDYAKRFIGRGEAIFAPSLFRPGREEELRDLMMPLAAWAAGRLSGTASMDQEGLPGRILVDPSESLRVTQEAAKRWYKLASHPPIHVMWGVGDGTRTINQIKASNDLEGDGIAENVFRQLDAILDRLQDLWATDEGRFWAILKERYGIVPGADARREERYSWRHFYHAYLPKNTAPRDVERTVLMELLQKREARYEIPIPEGFVHLAILRAYGIPPALVSLDAGSTRLRESLAVARDLIAKDEKAESILVFHHPAKFHRVEPTIRQELQKARSDLRTRFEAPFALDRAYLDSLDASQLTDLAVFLLNEVDLAKTNWQDGRAEPLPGGELRLNFLRLVNELAAHPLTGRIESPSAYRHLLRIAGHLDRYFPDEQPVSGRAPVPSITPADRNHLGSSA
ncbi:MAG TPA: hypothetical protein VMU17_01295, partial [Elusimicrobiota bacterium]|nr:hypothetical protein [Elusimicrobiota bacterium]